jgi:hypothetical protein
VVRGLLVSESIYLCHSINLSLSSGNDLWRYDSQVNTWTCIYGVCNSFSTVNNESSSNPAYIGASHSPKVVYSSLSNSLIVSPRYIPVNNDSNFIVRNDVWVYDLTADKWYRVLDNSAASYSALGVPSISNRPPNTTLGETVIIQDQVYLVGVGSEEKWSLTMCGEGYRLSNSTYNCTACGNGEGSLAASGQCSNCSSGKYSIGSGCMDCVTGYSSLSGASSCSACGIGEYSVSGSVCTSCPGGKFGNSTALGQCVDCPAGYSSTSGSSNCTMCGIATYSLTNSNCSSCPAGKFGDQEGLSVCKDCSEGYTSIVGSSNCTLDTQCLVGRTLNPTDGTCMRNSVPSMVWTWISGSSTNVSPFNSTSFGTGRQGKMVGSRTQSKGYLFGGNSTFSVMSRRIYSFSSDFSQVNSLSECSSTNYGTVGVESNSSCPEPRVPTAVWLIEDAYVYVFAGNLDGYYM